MSSLSAGFNFILKPHLRKSSVRGGWVVYCPGTPQHTKSFPTFAEACCAARHDWFMRLMAMQPRNAQPLPQG